MCSEFPTSRNPKATVTHGGCSPTELKPSCRDAANPLFWGTQHLPKLQHSEEQLMQQALSPEHGTALWASQVPHLQPPAAQRSPGGAGEPGRTHPTPGSGGSGTPPADPSPRGALTKMTRLKRIIMTLIKVKHPIFAPGESREVTGGPSPSTAAASRVQGKPGSPHGRGGTEPDLPVRRAAPNTSPRPAPARCASAAPPVPPFMGRVPGPDPPPRPAPGATPGAAGSPQPCCPLLLSAAGCRRGTRSCPCSPCHGDGGRQRYQPRGCFSPSRRLQLWGHHPAALLGVMGAVLGVSQLWHPRHSQPPVTASPGPAQAEAPHLHWTALWVTAWSPFSAPPGQGSLQTPNFQYPGPKEQLAKEGAGERPHQPLCKGKAKAARAVPKCCTGKWIFCWWGHNRVAAGGDSDSHDRCQRWSSRRRPAIA